MSFQPKILVTGATGFIGRALVDELARRGRFSITASTRKNPGNFPDTIDVVEATELSPDTDWTRAIADVEIVIHCAGRAHVMTPNDEDQAMEFHRVNCAGTLALARQASAAGVKRFVFISSIGVNGNETHDKAFTEDSTPNPVTPYGQSKLEAEQALVSLSEHVAMSCTIIRPPLVYGVNAPGNLARLKGLVRRNIPLPFGNVANKRHLVARENLVDFIIHAMEHEAAADEVFLVSDNESLTTTEIIRRMAFSQSKKPKLIPVPPLILTTLLKFAGKGDLASQLFGSLEVDNSKAKLLLGWEPPVRPDTAEWD